MKLIEIQPEVEKRFLNLSKGVDLKKYAQELKESGNFNDFQTRLAWDVLKACFTCFELCEWYDKYDCNDGHITTLAKKCLNKLEII